MNLTQQFAANVVKTDFSALNKETIERAKWRLIDCVGCAISGANAPGCQAMLNLTKQWGGTGESTILVHGIKAPAPNAAVMNSLMIRSYDYEPVESEFEEKMGPAHISGTTTSTAITMADKQSASGKDLITALVIGDDIASRLGANSGFDFALGWDNTGTINVFGATAISAKLLKLNEKQVFNALGIALNRMCGTMAGVFDKTLAFKLPIAMAAREGIFAAELARLDYPGIKDALMGPRGYFSMYCKNYDASKLDKDLGKVFYADCIIKPWSACRATHPSIETALKISQANDIKPEDIDHIDIHLTPGTCEVFVGQPFSFDNPQQPDGAFTIRYTVASALLWKEVKPKCFTTERLNDPKIKMLIDKMKQIPSIPPEKSSLVKIEVFMKDGKKYSAQTDFAKGHFRKTPLSTDDLRAKYRDNVEFSQTISKANSEKALSLLENLEKVDNIHEVIRLLVKA